MSFINNPRHIAGDRDKTSSDRKAEKQEKQRRKRETEKQKAIKCESCTTPHLVICLLAQHNTLEQVSKVALKLR